MPFESSLPKTSCGVLHMDAQGNPIPCPVDAEPQGSANSSGDEKCRECGCTRSQHMGKPQGCLRHGFHAFVPAEPEAGPERRKPIGFGFDGAAKCGACSHTLDEHRWYQTRGSIFPERDDEIRLFRMQCAGCAVLAEPPVRDMHEFVPAPPGCEGCPDPEHGDDPCGAEGCLCQHPVPEPFVCAAPEGRCPDPDSCLHGCRPAADELTRLGQEMEPEPPEHETENCTCSSRETDGNGRIMHYYGCGMPYPEVPDEPRPTELAPCADCDTSATCAQCGCCIPGGCTLCEGCAFDMQLRGVVMTPRPEAQPPQRPSYAVAYATGSGALIELALPGDASAAVVNGALVICHPSGVLGIQHVKPCGEAE